MESDQACDLFQSKPYPTSLFLPGDAAIMTRLVATLSQPPNIFAGGFANRPHRHSRAIAGASRRAPTIPTAISAVPRFSGKKALSTVSRRSAQSALLRGSSRRDLNRFTARQSPALPIQILTGSSLGCEKELATTFSSTASYGLGGVRTSLPLSAVFPN